MGINQLQLSQELIAVLYPEALVNSVLADSDKNPSDPDKPVPSKKSGYAYLGKNLRSICFLVSYPEEEFVPREQLVFLQKMLAACHCSLDDIALINAKNHPVTIEILKDQFHPGTLFLWGIPPSFAGIGVEIPDMTIETWENLRIVPVLQTGRMIIENPEGLELKRILWMTLKKLFNL